MEIVVVDICCVTSIAMSLLLLLLHRMVSISFTRCCLLIAIHCLLLFIHCSFLCFLIVFFLLLLLVAYYLPFSLYCLLFLLEVLVAAIRLCRL